MGLSLPPPEEMKYQQDMALRYDHACPNLIRSAVLRLARNANCNNVFEMIRMKPNFAGRDHRVGVGRQQTRL
jgi:hypothetical protein